MKLLAVVLVLGGGASSVIGVAGLIGTSVSESVHASGFGKSPLLLLGVGVVALVAGLIFLIVA
jgi:hypothetical protein